jgi:hypothetical protein
VEVEQRWVRRQKEPFQLSFNGRLKVDFLSTGWRRLLGATEEAVDLTLCGALENRGHLA